MKKISVIGATGFVGSHVVKELADRGYEVLAIARNVSGVATGEHIKAAQADVNDPEALAGILQGSDAVVSTFNPGWTNPNIYNDFLQGARNIEKAVEASGVKRFIVVGGAGSLYTPDHKQLVDGPGFPAEIRPGAEAARDYLERSGRIIGWTGLFLARQ